LFNLSNIFSNFTFLKAKVKNSGTKTSKMNKQLLIEFIKANTPNVMFGWPTLEKIAEQFEERTIARNELLIKGNKAGGYFYLAEGFVRAFTYDHEGNDVTTCFYTKDHIVFEVAACYLQMSSTEYVQAVTECKGYFAPFEKANMLFHMVPEFREFARAMLMREFSAYKQRTLAMINKSAEERYDELMQNNRMIFQHAPLKQIASFLGVTDTSLSRIRRDYSKRSANVSRYRLPSNKVASFGAE
jgi:CRP-like cAMP-binding protein